jgi:hypothetical protein
MYMQLQICIDNLLTGCMSYSIIQDIERAFDETIYRNREVV